MSNSASSYDEWMKRWSSWDYHFERIRNDKEMTDAGKAEILRGFQALRQIMGEAWLSEVVRSRHPLFHRLMNLAPWSQLSVARLGHQLQAFQTAPNFDRLRKKLINKDQYAAAEAELEVASYFRSAGFLVEFYPPVDSKEADVCIKIDGKEFYIEVSVVGDSKDARKASQTLHDLTWPFFAERDVVMSGKVFKTLSTPHRRELKRRIASVIQEVKNTQECQEVVEPGVLQFFIAPREKIEDVKMWQQRTEISGLGGPPINVDEVRRLRKRLEEKNRQLPEDKPGVIVVYAYSLTRQFFEPDFYPQLMYELEETVYEHENLIFGAVIASGSDLLPQIVIKDGNYVLGHRQSHVPSMSQDVLVIKNRFSKFPIDEDVVHALLGTSFPHHRSDKSQQHTHDQ